MRMINSRKRSLGNDKVVGFSPHFRDYVKNDERQRNNNTDHQIVKSRRYGEFVESRAGYLRTDTNVSRSRVKTNMEGVLNRHNKSKRFKLEETED
jgi:hypothetical protein